MTILATIPFIILTVLAQEPPGAAPQPVTTNPDTKSSDSESLLKMNEKLDKLLKEKEAKEKAALQKRNALIEKQPSKLRKLIVKGEICLDMNHLQVELSWGKPEHVNRTTHRGGVHEQWVYPRNCFVYFENGLVTAIQN